MPSWYVSTPLWTCRVDVQDNRILPTTARYLHRQVGQPWDAWLARQQQAFGRHLQVRTLDEERDRWTQFPLFPEHV